MAEGIQIEIVSPEKLVLSELARSVTIPGTEGYFTVMGDHAPLLSTLKPGFITVTGQDGTARTYYVRGGFADVSPERLTILADEASTLADFDRADIERRLSEAQERLAKAETHEDRSFAQELVSGWMNLMMEAGQLNQAHIH
ncbi:MAG TPA: F0F1 ATP synthase subunit epsilon [Devosiaceae bacterium]|jgi:F-type H+-transporting ATPase subunit epsilon